MTLEQAQQFLAKKLAPAAPPPPKKRKKQNIKDADAIPSAIQKPKRQQTEKQKASFAYARMKRDVKSGKISEADALAFAAKHGLNTRPKDVAVSEQPKKRKAPKPVNALAGEEESSSDDSE